MGYLTYNEEEWCVSIPNKEVGQEYINAIRGIGWNEVISILQYNDENALIYMINLAFYAAREYYHIVLE